MINLMKRFIKEEEGATGMEYGLMAALIAAVIVGTLVNLGGTVNTVFNIVDASIQGT